MAVRDDVLEAAKGLLVGLMTPWGAVASVVVVTVALFIAEYTYFALPYPKGMQLAMEPPNAKRFSLRTRLAYYFDCERLFCDVYERYTKKGIPVVLPIFGSHWDVILPLSDIKWYQSQPDKTISNYNAFVTIDQIEHSLGDIRPLQDPWQGGCVKNDLNKVLETISTSMQEELHIAIDRRLGLDTDHWQEVNLNETMRMIIAQASTRFSYGPELSRNDDYLKLALDINDGLVINAGVANMVPKPLVGIVTKIANVRLSRAIRRISKTFVPLWQQRLTYLKYSREEQGESGEPWDHIQMMARFAEKHKQDEMRDWDLMAKRMIAVNFGAMHNTVLQATNMMVNVLSSDAEHNTIATLREEFDRVIGRNSQVGDWDRSVVAKLIRADSVARETFRLGSFNGRAVFRKVMVGDLHMPDGTHLPKDTMISLLSYPAQVDKDTYGDDALDCDPFRFSRMREAAIAKGEPEPNVSFLTTSYDFLPFGHGKHACPGRYLLDFELKMILAYILQNYDMKLADQYKGKRPPSKWLAEVNMPPANVKVLFKRRGR